MARWKLRDAHYLAVPGTEWEYKESDRESGRSARKIYEVPLYLNPNIQADWTHPAEQMIVVTDKFDRANPRDIVFVGPPTPDMEPLDDEAQAISQRYIDSGAWVHPIESINMTYSESRLSEFERAIAMHVSNLGQTMPSAPTVSLKGTDDKRMSALEEQVKQLIDMNAQLQAQLLEKKPARRV